MEITEELARYNNATLMDYFADLVDNCAPHLYATLSVFENGELDAAGQIFQNSRVVYEEECTEICSVNLDIACPEMTVLDEVCDGDIWYGSFVELKDNWNDEAMQELAEILIENCISPYGAGWEKLLKDIYIKFEEITGCEFAEKLTDEQLEELEQRQLKTVMGELDWYHCKWLKEHENWEDEDWD